jgi:hypothetical protein
MKYKLFNVILLSFVLTITVFFVYGVENEKQARKLFRNKQYSEVVDWYQEQFRSSPDQYLFAYYYGVCRTETDQLNEETRDLLMKASQENVPEDVFFYLAKNEHALSNFHNALAHYNHFASLVNKKTQGQYGLDTLIVQSQNQVNPFRALQVVVQLEPDTIVESLPKPVVIEIPEKLADTIIEFRITPQVAYRHISQFKTEDAQLAFVDAWLQEQRLDSLYKAVAQARENYLKIDDFSAQQEAAALILQLETEWLALKPWSIVSI